MMEFGVKWITDKLGPVVYGPMDAEEAREFVHNQVPGYRKTWLKEGMTPDQINKVLGTYSVVSRTNEKSDWEEVND